MEDKPVIVPKEIYVEAPQQDRFISGDIMGAWIFDDEKVEWLYSYLNDGSTHVTGFLVTKNNENAKRNA